MKYALVLPIIVLFPALAIAQTTYYVPDDYNTIQDAIGACANGDTVIVRSGTYIENLDFLGKAITVMSESGPDVTIVDGGQPSNPDFGSVVIFQSGEGPDSILDGFTLLNGTGTYHVSEDHYDGGGVSCWNDSAPTIINNIIRNNSANWTGGGIFLAPNCAAVISGNTISDNSVDDGGGGIFSWDSASVITNNLVTRNTAWYAAGILCAERGATISENIIVENACETYGGGVYCAISDSTVTNNTIVDNTSWYGGAGIHLYNSNTLVKNNLIARNMVTETVGYGGGGIEIYFDCSPTISGNMIVANSAGVNEGGGISCQECSPVIVNNVIHGNSANTGGGIDCRTDCTVTLTNNTICGNSADKAGGICAYKNCDFTITNSILWGNSASEGKEMWLATAAFPSTITISHSDVEGGQDSVLVGPNCTLNWGAGMIDADPLFVDSVSGDFHLTCGSPCYKAGDNAAPSLPTEDFEGDPRVVHDSVEMGADEYFCHLYCVGDPVPGDTICVCVAAIPWQEVTLYRGDDVLETPYWTGHGFMYITWPAAASWYLGQIPKEGVMALDITIPVSWVPGESYFFQALVGKWGETHCWLTNLVTLTAE